MKDLKTKRIIALMSGTSCDSIDVGLCIVKPDFSCSLIDAVNYKYPELVREKIFEIFSGNCSVEDICQMNFVIGECFANAANELIKIHGKPDFISSHGQTIFHSPQENFLSGFSTQSTFQIGDSAIIAERTGCTTVSNFREADIAAGGNGAPLVCFADEMWFKPLAKNVAIQNIGGISNVTVISKDYQTFGFDTGVGNIMLDYCANKFFSAPYDKDGLFAKEGQVCETWLDCLLLDEYYFLEPPKTTGREYFSPMYIENALKIAPDNKYDVMATLSALCAKTIATAYERFVYPNTSIDEVVLGGGGAYNPVIKEYLRKFLPKSVKLKSHEDYGISNNFKEVMAFALLGYCSYYGIKNNVPECTGAKKKALLGKFTYCERDISEQI